ncbi:Protein of unknown function [Gryllus bimaculatus]|nr:Protein of unknown function [Gryllus bimaculatus]
MESSSERLRFHRHIFKNSQQRPNRRQTKNPTEHPIWTRTLKIGKVRWLALAYGRWRDPRCLAEREGAESTASVAFSLAFEPSLGGSFRGARATSAGTIKPCTWQLIHSSQLLAEVREAAADRT